MNNIEILKQIQDKYKDYDRSALINYITNLIRTEYLRNSNDEHYFNDNFENILLGTKVLNNNLDYAIDQAIFITLQPLRNDIDAKKIEQTLLNWSGYILNRDINSGKYPQDIMHYFEDNEAIDFTNMNKKTMKKIIEYDNMVSSDKKSQCTKVLCKKVIKLLSTQAKKNDKSFYKNLAIINYRFIRIHPFEDGNGRISRMLLNYMFNSRIGCIPIALNNDEINELIEIYKETSKIIYSVFMGGYLSNLEYDDSGSSYVETEEVLTENINNFLYNKEAQASLIKPISFKKS